MDKHAVDTTNVQNVNINISNISLFVRYRILCIRCPQMELFNIHIYVTEIMTDRGLQFPTSAGRVFVKM